MKALLISFLILNGCITPSYAWDHHQEIMIHVLDTLPAIKRDYLRTMVKIPSAEEQLTQSKLIAAELTIDEKKIPVFTSSTKELSVNELLIGTFIDEPDQGMDQNLPDSADPQHDRAWMGGSTGPTSQGFRHMYFAGFTTEHPMDTFQIPFRPVGQAPEYFRKLIKLSERKFDEHDLFWAVRTLAWGLHIMQDVHQPFHVTQLPSLHMVPWNSLFSNFVARTTQSISNYHYAYEGLALEYMKESRTNKFRECFEPTQLTMLPPSAKDGLPDLMPEILEVRNTSPALGAAVYAVFGKRFKERDVDLPRGIGSVDYYAIAHASASAEGEMGDTEDLSKKAEAATQLRTITCGLIKKVSELTWGQLDREFHFSDNSMTTGK